MMFIRILFFFSFLFISVSHSQGQSLYSIVQGGGTLGFANEGYKGAFNGYSAHVILGKSFNKKAYLGLGVGTESYKGDFHTNDPHANDQKTYQFSSNALPIFVDGRLPIGIVGEKSQIGILANAGYAPSIGDSYHKGALFKGGFFYNQNTASTLNFTVSAAYSYQELKKGFDNFQHQGFNISIGLIIN